MNDDEIEDLDGPPEDAASFLDQLDSDPDELGGDHPPTNPALSRREIDELIDRALDEELARLQESRKKK